MFVNCLSEIDFTLSQVNVLLSEVNSKLELCSAESRKLVLSRLSNILSEMMWAVSLSADEGSGSECDVSSYSADVESLAWDSSEDLYKIYYNDTEDDHDYDERIYEDDDHGPMDSSVDTSPDVEDVKVESLLERSISVYTIITMLVSSYLRLNKATATHSIVVPCTTKT